MMFRSPSMSQFINYHYILSSHFISVFPRNKCLVISHLKIIKLFVLEGEGKHTWEILSIQNLTLTGGNIIMKKVLSFKLSLLQATFLASEIDMALFQLIEYLSADWATDWLWSIFHHQIFSLRVPESIRIGKLLPIFLFSFKLEQWRLQARLNPISTVELGINNSEFGLQLKSCVFFYAMETIALSDRTTTRVTLSDNCEWQNQN